MKNFTSSIKLLVFAFLGLCTKPWDEDVLDTSKFVSTNQEELEKSPISVSSNELLYAC